LLYTSGPYKGKLIKGIYKIDSNRFTCCYGRSGQDLPSSFETTAGPLGALFTPSRRQRTASDPAPGLPQARGRCCTHTQQLQARSWPLFHRGL